MDSAGQSMALQQLRQQQQQHKLPLPADTYVSPDNLRDAANRIFARNHSDRASFDAAANSGQQHFLQQQQQQYQQHHQNLQQQQNGHQEQPYYSNIRRNSHQTPPARSAEDPRRNSYANQSFRKATGQEKTPPQVPPKPGSRSTSRERIAIDQEVENLDQELKHILRGGGGRQSLNTPPLPALSPDPESPDHKKGSSKPDLLEHRKNQQQQVRQSLKRYQDELSAQTGNGQQPSLTADLESVLGGLQTDLTLSGGDDDGDLDATDAAAIRRQLDGLEGMYSEVLKLLGLNKYGRAPQTGKF